MPTLLSELEFGAFLAYSPHGPRGEEPHRSSQRLRAALKEDGLYRSEPAIDLAVRRLREISPASLVSLLGPDALLVPAPRSAPFPSRDLDIPLWGRESDFLWVPRRICEVLVAECLASRWLPLLRRERKVTRSAAARPSERPLPAEHMESMSCSPILAPGCRVVVVDDVVTRGATLLACASWIRHVSPEIEVSAFALLRAVSNPSEFEASWIPSSARFASRPRATRSAGHSARDPSLTTTSRSAASFSRSS